MKRLLLTILIISLAGFALAQNTTKLKSNLTIEKAAPMLYLNGTSAGIDFYNGDVVLQQSANTLTLSGGDLALGANNITMTGALGATGGRILKGWFTDLEVTNTITGTAASVTGFTRNSGTLSLSGGHGITLTTTGTTALTLPTSGTLATTTQLASYAPLANPALTGTTTIATAINPDANDGATLGALGTAWSDLFLADGGMIGWNSSTASISVTGMTMTFGGPVDFVFDDGSITIAGSLLLTSPDVNISQTELSALDGVTGTIETVAGASAQINDTINARIAAATVGLAAADTNTYGGAATRTFVESLLGDGAGLSAQRLPFIVDVTAGAPSAADTIVVHSAIAGKHVDVYRDGAKQYQNFTTTNTVEGFRVSEDTIFVNPAWQANEQVMIDIIQPILWSYLSFSETGELTDGLLSYWKMDEVSGNLVDALGYKNLTISGAPTPQQTGKLNYCWSYDGTDDFHGAADTLYLNHRDAFTVSVWVKTMETTSNGSIIGAMDGAGNGYGWRLSCSSTEVTMGFCDGTTAYTRTVSTDISDQAWHHVAITYDGTDAQLYIDGSPDGASLAADVAYATYAYFRINRIDGEYLDAYIDNIGYWHKCLSAAGVAGLYDLENTGTEYPWN
jgi:hypothetical protein